MKATPSLVLVVFCSLLLVGCGTERFNATSGWAGPVLSEGQVYLGSRDGRVLALDLHTGSQQRYSFPPETEDGLEGIYGTPLLAGGQLFVGGYDGRLYALDPADLTIQWQYPSEANPPVGRIVGGPTVPKEPEELMVAGEVVIFGSSDGYVRALQRSTGALAWQFQTGDMVWSTPTVEGEIVYVSSLDHHVYALTLLDGSLRWPVPFEADGAIVTSPLVVGRRVFVGSFDRNFYALDASSGRELWRFEGDAWFWSSPITDGNMVYAASMSGKLYALNLETGLEQWEFDLESPILSTPVLVEDRIIVTSDAGLIYTLSAATGKADVAPFSVDAEVRAPLAVRDGTVYVSDMDRRVRAVRVIGGQAEVWCIITSNDGDCNS